MDLIEESVRKHLYGFLIQRRRPVRNRTRFGCTARMPGVEHDGNDAACVQKGQGLLQRSNRRIGGSRDGMVPSGEIAEVEHDSPHVAVHLRGKRAGQGSVGGLVKEHTLGHTCRSEALLRPLEGQRLYVESVHAAVSPYGLCQMECVVPVANGGVNSYRSCFQGTRGKMMREVEDGVHGWCW